jgi:hypothetical protein
MQSASERRRLLDTMHQERVNPAAILTKCAAGLAIIVLLATMVVSDGRVVDGTAAQGTTPSRAAVAGVRTEEHRKQVFDERHQRFQGDAEQRSVASKGEEPANNQSPVVLW